MKYISTRLDAPALSFEDVVLQGLATDGGLYVPDFLPRFDDKKLSQMKKMTYQELFFEVTECFIGDEIDRNTYREIIAKSYKNFSHEAIAPLKQLNQNEFLLELFHGPTLAFKDFALQFLGNLLEHFLTKRNENIVIVGATSGDTGSAAIQGCKACKHASIFILHPHNKVSEVQRKQMTSVIEDNVFNIAISGNFDDCQSMVKEMFKDQSFLNGKRMVAVNSINFARIMAQIVYYFYCSLRLGASKENAISFSVPTGNFGDIFAGYLARNMGLPINQLVVATNKNDILHRFISQNDYKLESLHHTLSPSMDIMVSSNFERLLFDLFGRDGEALSEQMNAWKTASGSIEEYRWQAARALFDSYSVNDERTCEVIKEVFDETEYLLDPHTAIGVEAARQCRRDRAIPMVTLATAHPVKFPEAIEKSGVDISPELPHHLSDLFGRKEKYDVIENNLASVHRKVAEHRRK